jgi:ribosomal protein L12E/L44/L45/RPP1/RPP2
LLVLFSFPKYHSNQNKFKAFTSKKKTKTTMAETNACVYAALMLDAAGKDVNAKTIAAAVESSGMECSVTLPILFERFLAKKSIMQLITAAAMSAAPDADAAPAGAAPAAAPAAGKAAAKKQEEEEEDGDMMSLF